MQAAPAAVPDAGAEPTDPVELAALRFKNLCSTCHGANGDAQTPTAAALNPKPRNFTDAEWQKATPDDAIRKIILEGGVAVGKSPAMPANPDLKDKPQVVDALLKTIRGFSK
jgi:mono/diheme cytochrome c family protein